jgi:hypothetical protein
MRFPSIALAGGNPSVLASLCIIAVFGVSGCGSDKPEEFHAYGARNTATQSDSPPATDGANETKDVAENPDSRSEVRVAEAPGDNTASTASVDEGATIASSERLPSGQDSPTISRERPRRVSPSPIDPSGPFADDAAIAETPPRPIELLIPEKLFKTEKGALKVTFDDLDLLKVLGIENGVPVPSEAVDKMPQWMKGLEGQRIRIQGFMYPQFSDTGIPRFVFTRDTGVCCFGPNPTLYYLIDVRMKEGTTADYIENRRFEVVGTFRIQPSGDGKTLDELYRIDDAEIKTR